MIDLSKMREKTLHGKEAASVLPRKGLKDNILEKLKRHQNKIMMNHLRIS